MLNKIILALISTHATDLKAMSVDDFESPSHYKGWILPLRYLLALRYLKVKQQVLAQFRLNKTYPVSDADFTEAMLTALSGTGKRTGKKHPVSALGFKASLIYPLLLVASLFGLYQLNDWYQTRKIENVLANHLPFYSDLLHQKLMLKNNNHASILKKIDEQIEIEEQKILADLPEKEGVRAMMAEQLEKLKDSSTSSEDIMYGFKAMNTLLDAKGFPFYLTPKSFSMPCSSLIDATVEEMMMLKQLESLMSNNNPERCRTTMMTVYKVNKRDRLMLTEADKETELPLFHVNRVDKVPAIDSALGLTFKDRGIGSIILTDRISNFAYESVLPALTFQGRNYIIPYWMQGYYEIEEAITRGYKKDLEDIYPNKVERLKVKKVVKAIIKNKNRMKNAKLQKTLERQITPNESNIFGNSFDAISVLLGKQYKDKKNKVVAIDELENIELVEKLKAVLLPSIEYHEAYHQIVKKDWKKPSWVDKTFKDELSENGLDHTMEELGAYLSQLANTEQGLNIWLSKLLIFSLNPMTKGQAEYYSSSIIFSTLESLYRGGPIVPNYQMNIDQKTEIYKTLIEMDKKEIRELSKRAYEVLFEREVPVLR